MSNIGRPSDYTEELALTICMRIADGESLRTICKSDEMPDRVTVYRWLNKHEAFRNHYARAREEQADTIFDEVLDIADDGTNDWMERSENGEKRGWLENGEALARSKIRIDARKWMAGKLRPKKYGEKSVVEGPGPNGEHVVVTSAMTPKEAADAYAATLHGKKG